MFMKNKKFGNFTSNVSGKPALAVNAVGKLFTPVTRVVTGVAEGVGHVATGVATGVADGVGHVTSGVGKMTMGVTKKVVPETMMKKAMFRSYKKGDTVKVKNLTAKSKEELNYLQKALKTCFLFEDLSVPERELLAEEFEHCAYKKGATIVEQGEPGDHFYVLYGGIVVSEQDGERGGSSEDEEGDYYCFGEMSLLYKHPWGTTIVADTDAVLFRIDYHTFRLAMEDGSKSLIDDSYVSLLKQAQGLGELDATTLGILGQAMQKVQHDKGAVILDTTADGIDTFDDVNTFPFMVIQQGKIGFSECEMGGQRYDPGQIGPGEKHIAFGWQVLIAEGPINVKVKITALEAVTALVIDRATLSEIVGDFASLALRMAYKRQLNSISVFKDSQLEDTQLSGLVGLIHKRSFWRRTVLYKHGQTIEPALCFVRSGTCTLTNEDGETKKIEKGGFFGQDGLLADQNKEIEGPPKYKSRVSAVVSMDCVLDILTLEDCRKVLDTTFLGLGKPTKVSSLDSQLTPDDLTRHVMLGAGSFGQVWLATAPGKTAKTPRIFALKVQSKYQLVSTHQAEGVVGECNIMASLKSPFIIRLFQKFQDEKCIYMLTSLLQGGELGDVIDDGLCEVDAKFYAAGILEGLTYMHQKHIIHRDLKPENVLINTKGYPVIIDLGFAKYVTDKTYTCCGTPMYIAPEVVNFKGHNKSADHWSWACMIYEMVTGDYAFYEKGMTEVELFKKIGRGEITMYGWMSIEVKTLILHILDPNPSLRLGNGPTGWFDIMDSAWFKDVDFKELRRQTIEAPWVPNLKNPLDSSNFADMSNVQDKAKNTREPHLTVETQAIFKAFGEIIPTPKF